MLGRWGDVVRAAPEATAAEGRPALRSPFVMALKLKGTGKPVGPALSTQHGSRWGPDAGSWPAAADGMAQEMGCWAERAGNGPAAAEMMPLGFPE